MDIIFDSMGIFVNLKVTIILFCIVLYTFMYFLHTHTSLMVKIATVSYRQK